MYLQKEKHGLAFEEAKSIFEGKIFLIVDRRKEYEEIREIRIISARLAKTKERRMYKEHFKKKTS